MGREGRDGKAEEGKGRGRRGGEGRGPPIFYCTPSSSFSCLVVSIKHRQTALTLSTNLPKSEKGQ